MKTYEYKGFDGAGHVAHGLVEALSVKEAREKLSARGILAEKIRSVSGMVRLNTMRRAMVFRGLGELLKAGMPLAKALEMMIRGPQAGPLRIFLAGVRDRVGEGSHLSDALAEGSHSITPFERAVVEAGERSGTLEIMMNRLGEFLEEQDKIKDRIQGALLYPAIVVTMGICLGAIMLGVFIPRTVAVIQNGGMELPLLTRGMMAIGQFAEHWLWLLVVAAIAGTVLIRQRLAKDEAMRLRWDAFQFHIPVLGSGRRLLVCQRFARTLALLLTGGIPMVESLGMAGRATGSEWLARLSERAGEDVRHGKSVSEVVGAIPPFRDTLAEWMRIGEMSGNMEHLLREAGERYRGDWEKFVSRCLSVAEPVLIILIGIFVLLVTLSVLLPILSLSQSIGG